MLNIKTPPYKHALRNGVIENPEIVGINEADSLGSSNEGRVGRGRGVGVSTTGWSIIIDAVGGRGVGVTVGGDSGSSTSSGVGVGVSVGKGCELATTTC